MMVRRAWVVALALVQLGLAGFIYTSMREQLRVHGPDFTTTLLAILGMLGLLATFRPSFRSGLAFTNWVVAAAFAVTTIGYYSSKGVALSSLGGLGVALGNVLLFAAMGVGLWRLRPRPDPAA